MATYTATTTPQQVAAAGTTPLRFTNLGREPILLTGGGAPQVLAAGVVGGSAVFTPSAAVQASTRRDSSQLEVVPASVGDDVDGSGQVIEGGNA